MEEKYTRGQSSTPPYIVLSEDRDNCLVQYNDGSKRQFISSRSYVKKYGIHQFAVRQACLKEVLIAIKRIVDENYKNQKHHVWFILDLPPDQHPRWAQHKATSDKLKAGRHKSAIGKRLDKNFDEEAPILLERFSKAMAERMMDGNPHSDFKTTELAKILDVDKKRIYKWTDIGIPEYGKLPKIKFDRDKHRVYDPATGTYTTQCGPVDDFFRQEDVVRWLKKLRPDRNKFKTVSDATASTNADELAAKEGWYAYDRSAVFPMSYEGFKAWVKAKIRVKDKDTGRLVVPIFHEKQEEYFRNTFRTDDKGELEYLMSCLSTPRGEGKCPGRNTPILMHDGTIKMSQNIQVGDILMGDDNTPRTVLSLARGRDEMFEIVPMRGEPFVVNKEHILSLKQSKSYQKDCFKHDVSQDGVVDITLKDYMAKGPWFRENHRLYRVPIDWPEQAVPLDPYFLGIWLGDGTRSNTGITTPDHEVIEHIHSVAKSLGLRVSVYDGGKSKAQLYSIVGSKGKPNELKRILQSCNILNNKHIPQYYKTNSRRVRLQLLAGLIDSDGSRNRSSIEITQKNETLANDIAFIARSLGFHCDVSRCIKGIKSSGFKGQYYRIRISGDCSIIPIKIQRKKCATRAQGWKDILVSTIKEIRPVGIDDYYGFTLDGNGRYLMGDFTVTHNSWEVALILLFRFFNMERQEIFLVSNSVDQTDFLLLKEIKNIIDDSPAYSEMKNTPALSVRKDGIYLLAGKNSTYALIESMSIEGGTRSNATCFAFSEIYKLTNEEAFAAITGSIRGVKNGQVLIESTVAPKGHIFHRLYEMYINAEPGAEGLYFLHYSDKFYNPRTTQKQLRLFEKIYLPHLYNMFFRNRWEDATTGVFDAARIFEIGVYGIDGVVGRSPEFLAAIDQMIELKRRLVQLGGTEHAPEIRGQVESLRRRFMWVHDLYQIPATADNLEKLMKVFSAVDIIMGAGIDRANQLDLKADRTAEAAIGRAITGVDDKVFLLLDLYLPPDASPRLLQNRINEQNDTIGFLSRIEVEEYQGKDLDTWCRENGYDVDLIRPSYERKKEMFTEFSVAVREGYFKAPIMDIWFDDTNQLHYNKPPMGREDILREEMNVFEHIPPANERGAGQFRSVFKKSGRTKPGEAKDDTIYAIGHGIMAAMLGELSALQKIEMWAHAEENKDVIGSYNTGRSEVK